MGAAKPTQGFWRDLRMKLHRNAKTTPRMRALMIGGTDRAHHRPAAHARDELGNQRDASRPADNQQRPHASLGRRSPWIRFQEAA